MQAGLFWLRQRRFFRAPVAPARPLGFRGSLLPWTARPRGLELLFRARQRRDLFAPAAVQNRGYGLLNARKQSPPPAPNLGHLDEILGLLFELEYSSSARLTFQNRCPFLTRNYPPSALAAMT